MADIQKFDIKQKTPVWLDLTVHVVSTAILAFFFYLNTGGWLWPILAVLGGIFIDIDHLIDYFIYYGFQFKIKDFFSCEYHKIDKCYIVFHSWEFLALLWLFSLNVSWMFPLVSGMTLHMLADTFLTHTANPRCYSFLYRWRRGFKLNIDRTDLAERRDK